MNTHGHHRVADEAGLPRLRQAFADSGAGAVNLTAFYFGNWLTDLSQAVDPNPGMLSFMAGEVGDRIDKEIGPVVAALHAFIDEQIGASDAKGATGVADQAAKAWAEQAKAAMRDIANAGVRQFRDAMVQLVGELATMGKGDPEDLNALLTAGVRFAAYRKFVHPDKKEPKLPFRAFAEIFERNFTQYFPHEHVDRPACGVTLDEGCARSWGPEAMAGAPKRLYANQLAGSKPAVGSSEPSIYAYLEETRALVSGDLMKLDRDWARTYLTARSNFEGDVEFHAGLANLGHTLHAVEDFFAHSNFIEHAAVSRGAAYLQGELQRDAPDRRAKVTARAVLTTEQADFAAVKVMRRLKRYEPLGETKESAGWAFLPDEHSIVTGYFDGWDTVLSLLHAFEELFVGGEPVTVKDVFTDYGRRFVEDRLGEIFDPVLNIVRAVTDDTPEGKLRKELDALCEYYTNNGILAALDAAAADQEIRKRIDHAGFFRGVPHPMMDTVVFLVRGLVRPRSVPGQTARLGWNLYQLFKTIGEVQQNPLAFLAEPLLVRSRKGAWFHAKFAAAWLEKIFLDPRFDSLRFDLRIRLHGVLGGFRVGSHSLLAKDYTDEPLFPQAFNCARALHWYVMDTLCRWADPVWTEAATDDSTWVDWHELLGHFLRHPRAYSEKAVLKRETVDLAGYEFHKVTSGEETFATIAKRLGARNGGTRRYGSYEELLLANLFHRSLFRADPVGGTRVDETRVAEIVVATRMGTATNGSYALREGLVVSVPFVVELEVERIEESLWFADMMDVTTEEWRAQIAAYRASKSRESRPPYEYHTATHFKGTGRTSAKAARDSFIDNAAALRLQLERKYGVRRKR